MAFVPLVVDLSASRVDDVQGIEEDESFYDVQVCVSLGAIGYETIWGAVFGAVAHRSYRGVWLVLR